MKTSINIKNSNWKLQQQNRWSRVKAFIYLFFSLEDNPQLKLRKTQRMMRAHVKNETLLGNRFYMLWIPEGEEIKEKEKVVLSSVESPWCLSLGFVSLHYKQFLRVHFSPHTAPFVEETAGFTGNGFNCLPVISWLWICGLISEISIILHWSACLFLSQDQRILVETTPKYVLKYNVVLSLASVFVVIDWFHYLRSISISIVVFRSWTALNI